jgi:toxin ParE1/3/4
MNLKFTNKAVNDLSDIWDYTLKNWSEKQAEKYYNLIIENCKKLGIQNKKVKDYNEIYPMLKGFKISKHLIFYLTKEDQTIEIIRILHEKMDYRDKLKI